MRKIKAQILKILNGNMTAICNNLIYECEPSGKAKKCKIIVGDYVELEDNKYGKKLTVSKVYERNNSLVRPAIANIDQLFLIISKLPKTDYILIDKMIIYCTINNIVPYIVINKIDLYNKEEIDDIIAEYKGIVGDVILTNGKTGYGIDNIMQYLPDKFSAFAGQSAVGKSTILNAIAPNLNLKTNGLSHKINRGMHTTRHSEIFVLDNNIRIADTAGFSMLNLDIDANPINLYRYYSDFADYCDCRYSNCDHTNINDKDCKVASAVKEGKINKNRYERYIKLYKILKEEWRKKYD